jgi:hypothetical protein
MNLAADEPRRKRTAPPRILMLSIVNPRLERNGAATVTRGLLKLLALRPLDAAVTCLPARTKPVRWHRLVQARSLALSSVSTLPSKAAFLYSREFRKEVAGFMEREQYDLVLLNGSDLIWMLEYLPASIPRILVAHNIEHLLFRVQIENLGRLYRPMAALLRRDCQRLKDYELRGIREIGNVIFLSQDDATFAGSVCEGLNSIVVPPVFDYEPGLRQPRKRGPTLEIGFLGNFKWWPNQLALQWFAGQILPRVKAPLRIHLFGLPGGPGRPSDPRIVQHGAIERLEEVWATCDFLICPVFPTGGVCVKLAEAVYNRMPVLATRHAARGLPLDIDPALVFLDEAGEWVEFLNSTAAAHLAERQVSEKTAASFALDTQREKLRQFVQSTAEEAFLRVSRTI